MCNCSNIPSFCQIIKDPTPVFWYFVGWWCEYPSLIELGRKFACTRTIYPPVNLSQFPSAQVEKKIAESTVLFFSGRFLTTFFQKLKRFQKKTKKQILQTKFIFPHMHFLHRHMKYVFTSSYFLQFTCITEKLIFFSIHVFFFFQMFKL